LGRAACGEDALRFVAGAKRDMIATYFGPTLRVLQSLDPARHAEFEGDLLSCRDVRRP